jgi:hypothetical protein
VKQLTILCSSDLAETVQDALVRAGVEGFLRVPGAVGVKPGAAAEHGRWPRWEAEMFVTPVTEDVLSLIVDGLRSFAGRCDVEPCLRILVSSLEAVY